MAISHKYVGGATGVAQVDEAIVTGTPADTETVTFTLTDENNAAHTAVTTLVTPADIEAARDQILAVLQASGDAEFVKVNWSSSSTDTILGTAGQVGRPFHLVITETMAIGGVTDNDGGTGNSVANAGKNDWNTLVNWEDAAGAAAAALPVTDSNVLFAEGSDSVLYGLVQTARLSTLKRTPGFTGSLGDPLGDGAGTPYPLRIDVDGTGSNKLTSDGRNGGQLLWRGTCTTVLISGSKFAHDAVYLAGDIDNVRLLGAACQGQVTIEDATTLDNLYVSGVGNLSVIVGENIASFDILEIDSGSVFCKSNPARFSCNGGHLDLLGDEDWTGDVNVTSGSVLYTGEGDMNTPGVMTIKGGSVSWRPKTSVALFTIDVLGGSFTDRDSFSEITYNGVVTAYGGVGTVHATGVNVLSD